MQKDPDAQPGIPSKTSRKAEFAPDCNKDEGRLEARPAARPAEAKLHRIGSNGRVCAGASRTSKKGTFIATHKETGLKKKTNP